MQTDQDGIRKAAILVSGLDRDAADQLLDQMEPGQARAVRQAVLEMGPIDPEDQKRVVDEFRRVRPHAAKQPSPGIEPEGRRAERLDPPERSADRAGYDAKVPAPKSGHSQARIAQALASSAYAREAPERSCKSGRQPFFFLEGVAGEKLVGLLAAERAQTIALVLSHLSKQQAGDVLVRLEPSLQTEVVRRLVDFDETTPEILREVERVVEERFSREERLVRRQAARLSTVAGILDTPEQGVGARILGNLITHDRDLAQRLGPSLAERKSATSPEPATRDPASGTSLESGKPTGPEPIAFDDLLALPDDALATLFEAVEPELAVLGLLGASPDLIDRLGRVLPKREAKRLLRGNPGPTRLRDVEEAQRRIVWFARRHALEPRAA